MEAHVGTMGCTSSTLGASERKRCKRCENVFPRNNKHFHQTRKGLPSVAPLNSNCRLCTNHLSNLYAKTEKGKARYRRAAQKPLARLKHSIRSRLKAALKRACANKQVSLTGAVDCTSQQLLAHLEKQFKPGMTLENWGTVWEVDHVLPVCAFDLTDPVHQSAVNHYFNLQPLFKHENVSKGGKYCRLLFDAYIVFYKKSVWPALVQRDIVVYI